MKENIAARRAARLAKETNGLAPTGDAGPVKADGNNGLAPTGGAVKACAAVAAPDLRFQKRASDAVSGAFAWLWGQIGNILFILASWSIFLLWRGMCWVGANVCTYCIWPALCCVGSLLAAAVATVVSEDVIPKYYAILQKFIKEHVTYEKMKEFGRILVINLFIALLIMMFFRIITSSQEWTRHVIFLFSGMHGRSMFKEGKMQGILFVIAVVFCIYYTPAELGVENAPQKNDVRCENLNSALFAKNLTTPHAFVRRNQLLDCVGRADDGDCKDIVKLAQYERKLDGPILEKHMKSNLLYSRHHHVMYRSNMTSFNLSLGDVTGASNPLTQIANVIWPGAKIDEKSVASPEQIMKDYGHLYMMVDCWRRSQQYVAEMESMNHLAHIFREVRATGDFLWFNVIRALNMLDEAKYAKQVSMLSVGFDSTLLTFEAFTTPWSDNTDYYQKHAVNVCSLHPCKFGVPVIMGLKSASSTKNNKCPPRKTCDVCTCDGCNASGQPDNATANDKAAQPENAPINDKPTQPENETGDDEPAQPSDAENENTDQQEANDEEHFNYDYTNTTTESEKGSSYFSWQIVLSIILFAVTVMAMNMRTEFDNTWIKMVGPTPASSRSGSRVGSRAGSRTVTPAPSRIASRPGSKSTSGTTTPNGTARNSGPKVDLSAGVWARLAAVAE